MSHRFGPPQRNPPQRNFQPINISIKGDSMQIVKDVLERFYNDIAREIKSESSFRKIHEIVISVLDTAEGLPNQEVMNFLGQQLARVRVIVEYQNARELIGDRLKDLLVSVINDLTNANQNDIKKLISNARLLMDSIAVIAKRES